MRSATLNDGENTIPAKFSSDCGGKLSSGAVEDNAVLKLTDVASECASEGERKPFAVINGFEVVKAVTPAAKVAKTEPKTPASAESDLLIDWASLRRWPWACDRSRRSEPARSTRCSAPRRRARRSAFVPVRWSVKTCAQINQ